MRSSLALICAFVAPLGAGAGAAAAMAQDAAVPPSVHNPADVHPATPMPADALVPGTPGVAALVCPVDPPPMEAGAALGAGAAAPAPTTSGREVRVEHPWAEKPIMTGAGTQVPVNFFKRGRTLIFDAGAGAGAEVIYIDRDHRKFTYTLSGTSGVITWRGTCHAES